MVHLNSRWEKPKKTIRKLPEKHQENHLEQAPVMAVSENGYTPSYGYPTKVIKSHDQPMDEMKQCPAMSSNAIAVGNRPSHGRCRGRYRRG